MINKKWSYDQQGQLKWNQKNISQLVNLQSYKKPVYIYDIAEVKNRAVYFKSQAPQGSRIFYAVKANSHPAVLKSMRDCGIGMDVVSFGEVELALKAGVSSDQIIFSGVGKTKYELTQAINLQIYQINVESLPELERISELTNQLSKEASVVLRVNPDVNVETHPYIATGFRDNKFGIDFASVDQALAVLQANPKLKFKGFSQHIGSQIFNISDFTEAFAKLIQIEKKFRDHGYASQVLDVGGGLGVFYDQDNEADEMKMCARYMSAIGELYQSSHLKSEKVEIQFEPGRWLVAHAGCLLSQVQYVKPTEYKTFLILDTGMNHLMRPCLYEAYHEIYSLVERQVKQVYDVVGPICESSDFLARDRQLSQLYSDDFVIIADCGAYGYSMASTYNAHELPEEIIINAN